MSSPPNPDQPRQTPTPGGEPEAGPFFQMSFFVPFSGASGPPVNAEAGAGDQGTGNEGTEVRTGEEGNNRRGVMWSFQFQPNRSSTPPAAATPPSGPQMDISAGGGAGNQRIPTSLPFSGPLVPPIPDPLPHLDLGSMLPPPPVSNERVPDANQAEGSGSEAAAPGPPAGFPQMIFFVRPDGSVGLDTPLPPPSINTDSPAPSDPTTSNQTATPRQNHNPFPFPFPFMFPFPFPSDPAPDPEQAKELLLSLPTVEEKVMRRVDRVYAAENTEDGGWKCGVCLEGWEEAEEGVKIGESDTREGTGVKRLPCNHLFHADCMEPWFKTKHTCPSCRLDLDPGRTLRSPSTLGLPLRPQPTGSGNAGTRDPHPYRRFHIHRPTATGPESAATASSSTSPVHDNPVGGAPAPAIPTRIGTSAFTIHIGPPPSAVNLARSASEPGSSDRSNTQAEVSDSSGAATGNTPPVMPTPLRRIGIMPRLGRTSPSSSPSPAGTEPTTVLPRFEPVAPQPNAQLPRPHHHHHHHHHHVHHNHPPHFHIHRATHSSASPSPNPPNAQTPPAQVETPFHFIFPAPPSRPSEPPKPVIHVPLETWLRNKEKGLGWRCDSEDCGIAPTGEKRDVFDRMRVDERPKVSDLMVVSPGPTGPAGEDGSGKECEHKYHPACFPEAVKLLLPPNNGCMDLDDFVQAECGICGIQGLVKWRDAEREEDMVERACGI